MKKVFGGLIGALILTVSCISANAADKLTLQLQWVTQAQFAGYYVAKDKGYYADEGLDLSLIHI